MASGRKRRHDLIRVNPAERTVALIGAGFSKGIGIPLQDELLGSLVTEGGQLLSKAIIGRDFDDHLGIEEFFTISDFHEFLELTSSGGSDSRSLIGVIPFKLLEAVHKASDQLRESFLSTVSPLITAVPVGVTLNWDTLLETLFASGGHRFSYFLHSRKNPPIRSEIAWVDGLVQAERAHAAILSGRGLPSAIRTIPSAPPANRPQQPGTPSRGTCVDP